MHLMCDIFSENVPFNFSIYLDYLPLQSFCNCSSLVDLYTKCINNDIACGINGLCSCYVYPVFSAKYSEKL